MSTNQIQQAVIYVRRAVTAQEDDVSRQEQACRDWCARNNWPLSPVYVERAAAEGDR